MKWSSGAAGTSEKRSSCSAATRHSSLSITQRGRRPRSRAGATPPPDRTPRLASILSPRSPACMTCPPTALPIWTCKKVLARHSMAFCADTRPEGEGAPGAASGWRAGATPHRPAKRPPAVPARISAACACGSLAKDCPAFRGRCLPRRTGRRLSRRAPVRSPRSPWPSAGRPRAPDPRAAAPPGADRSSRCPPVALPDLLAEMSEGRGDLEAGREILAERAIGAILEREFRREARQLGQSCDLLHAGTADQLAARMLHDAGGDPVRITPAHPPPSSFDRCFHDILHGSASLLVVASDLGAQDVERLGRGDHR